MRAIITTKTKACIIGDEKAIDKIENLRITNHRYKSQIIFFFRIPDQNEFQVETVDGELLNISSVEEFEEKCFEPRAQPPRGRNIIVGDAAPETP